VVASEQEFILASCCGSPMSRRHEIPRYTGLTAFLRRYIIDGHFVISRIFNLVS